MRQVVWMTMAFVLLASPVAAQTPEERAIRISKEVMSPFCPGLTVHDCPSNESVDLREEIEGWASDGLTDEQIYERLRAEYGDLIVTPDGRSWLVFGLPALALAGGLGLAFVVARRWSRETSRPADHTGLTSPAGEDHKRIESELGQMRDQRWGPNR